MPGTYIKVYVPQDVVASLSPQVSVPAYIRFLLETEIESNRNQARKKQHEIVIKYMPVVLDRATKWFKLTKGEIPLEDLIAVGQQEALKAAQRFDFERGTSFAPYVRMWADYGCRDLVRRTQAWDNAHQSLPEPREGEREEAYTEAEEDVVERSELREEIEQFILLVKGKAQRSRRRQLRALLAGHKGDEAARIARVSVQEVQETQEALRAYLQERGHARSQSPSDLTLQEVAAKTRIPLKSIYKQLTSGRLNGYKLQGTWRIPASELSSLKAPWHGHVDAVSEVEE